MKLLFRLGTLLLGVGCLVMLSLILSGESHTLAALGSPDLQLFKLLFLRILLEAFPFILIGVLFSALLQMFVSDELIAKIMPRNPFIGVVFGGLLGLLFPLCECGMIPVVRRLIRKGMPAYIGIVYLLAGPIVNPVVFLSTYAAFRSTPAIAYSRMGIAFLVATVIGLLIYRFTKGNLLKEQVKLAVLPHSQATHGSTGPKPVRFRSRLSGTIGHASEELFDMGKYLIIGALLTAMMQSFVDREALSAIADQPVLAYPFMMGFAFLLSICSTSDAFIASSFTGIFSAGPLLAFLVFGPMIDIKNMLMLLSAFRTKIVLAVALGAFVLVLAGAALMEAAL
ncbi:permease [Paenibacillus sp. NPDC058071]|uniref:permease n=1 Tax=Paenibacillus sp. NPDC058071 TaxID=3346326 RepID=UPI0036D7F5C7